MSRRVNRVAGLPAQAAADIWMASLSEHVTEGTTGFRRRYCLRIAHDVIACLTACCRPGANDGMSSWYHRPTDHQFGVGRRAQRRRCAYSAVASHCDKAYFRRLPRCPRSKLQHKISYLSARQCHVRVGLELYHKIQVISCSSAKNVTFIKGL